ncbi:hypothetical protein ABB02_01132 [Clostridiaceae bacterium JG1575]|nr:hypothetical protein ABB02_01132 [Clostridiaceae bacterium JG1575]
MKYFTQLAIILLFYLGGELIVRWTGLPLPGNIVGMILLLAALLSGLLKEHLVCETCDFFLVNLALFFVAPGVNLMRHIFLLSGSLGKTLLMIFITTLLTFASAALSAQFLIRLTKEENDD